MNRRLLAIAGTVALLAWTLGGVAAWALTKEGVQISVQKGPQGRDADDGLRLLDDRMGALEKDVRALAKVLGTNFERLQENVHQDGDRRAKQEEARLEADLGARLKALDGALVAAREERRSAAHARAARADARADRILAAVHDVATQRGALPAHAPAPVSPDTTPAEPTSHAAPARTARSDFPPPATALPPPPALPAPASRAGASAVAPSPPIPTAAPVAPAPPLVAPGSAGGSPKPRSTPEAPTAPPAPAHARGFLSFRLPSQSVVFAKRQRWRIVPSLSRVGFDGTSTLHGFSGVTSSLQGSLEVDLSRPARDPHAEIHVDAATLKTGIDERDAEMRAALGTRQHPRMSFELLSFTPRSVQPEHERVTGLAHGRMTIHGTSRAVDMPITLSLDASRRLHADGEARLDMTAYGISPPSKLGVVNVDKTVTVWIRLRARVQDGS